MKRLRLVWLVAPASTLVFAACGSSSDTTLSGATGAAAGTTATGGAASAGKAGATGKGGAGGKAAAGAGAQAGVGAQAGAAGQGGMAGKAGAAAVGGAGGSAGGGGKSGSAGAAGKGGAAAGGQGGAAGGGQAGMSGSSGKSGASGAGGCVESACKSGTTCAGGMCCSVAQACGAVCCIGTDVCDFGVCVNPGKPCVDRTDCAPGQYCDFAIGGAAGAGGAAGGGGAAGASGAAGAGASCATAPKPTLGVCLPLPPLCPPNMPPPPNGPITCVEKCEYKPPAPTFTPIVKYSWGGDTSPPYSTDVMMAPIVINLDDDNCDGKVNEEDIPEIVFSTFTGGAYFKEGTLHAISPLDGKLVDKWAKPGMVQPGGGLAAGDLDGDGVPEIVGCMNPGPTGASCCDALAQNTGAIAFRADGSTLWTQPDTAQVHCGYEAPAIADPLGNGKPLVLVGWTLLDGKTGAVVKNLDPGATFGAKLTSFYDVDGDGKLDVTDGQRAYRVDGTVVWDLRSGPDAVSGGYHAIGDLDKDGVPEIVIVSSSGGHVAHIIHHDPTTASHVKVVRKGLDINSGDTTVANCPGASSEYGGGPPTVADFDGDGFPDVGVAGAVSYAVFSGKLLMNAATPDAGTSLWHKKTHDCSSAVTGSSVFDFNGDGKAEILYSDEYHLWMYDGPTGNNDIPSTCNTTGTLWEYPLVADVDNDGQTEIVVASNAYAITCPDDGSKQAGIRVFGSANGSWVRTRRIWNEHTYHVTNVGEDGSIPKSELPNYSQPGLNDFRRNVQPAGEFSAPDLVVAVAPRCTATYGLVATVRNIGQASVPANVVVGFYYGAPGTGTLLGSAKTTKALHAAEAEAVVIDVSPVPAAIMNGSAPVYAVVDDGMPVHPWHECRTDNNVSAPVSGVCKQ